MTNSEIKRLGRNRDKTMLRYVAAWPLRQPAAGEAGSLLLLHGVHGMAAGVVSSLDSALRGIEADSLLTSAERRQRIDAHVGQAKGTLAELKTKVDRETIAAADVRLKLRDEAEAAADDATKALVWGRFNSLDREGQYRLVNAAIESGDRRTIGALLAMPPAIGANLLPGQLQQLEAAGMGAADPQAFSRLADLDAASDAAAAAVAGARGYIAEELAEAGAAGPDDIRDRLTRPDRHPVNTTILSAG